MDGGSRNVVHRIASPSSPHQILVRQCTSSWRPTELWGRWGAGSLHCVREITLLSDAWLGKLPFSFTHPVTEFLMNDCTLRFPDLYILTVIETLTHSLTHPRNHNPLFLKDWPDSRTFVPDSITMTSPEIILKTLCKVGGLGLRNVLVHTHLCLVLSCVSWQNWKGSIRLSSVKLYLHAVGLHVWFSCLKRSGVAKAPGQHHLRSRKQTSQPVSLIWCHKHCLHLCPDPGGFHLCPGTILRL